jgi:hypothetical protein
MIKDRILELLEIPWSESGRKFITAPPDSLELIVELERTLEVTFSDDLRWFMGTLGSISSAVGSEFRFLRQDATYAVLTLDFREKELLPPGYVVFDSDEDVIGGCWILDPTTDLVHTWNSYECNDLSPAFGSFLDFVVDTMEKLIDA